MGSDWKNNLFWRLMKTESSSAEGHEDFVTEALAGVLVTDQGLARHLLNSLIGEEVDSGEPIQITTQSTYFAERVGWSAIDLELRTESHLVFVEIKIGAPLNTYFVESETNDDLDRIDQIEKYDYVLGNLDSSYPIQRYLFAVGQEPLKQESKELNYYRRDFLWWDIYKIIDDYMAKGPFEEAHNEVGRYLANQFLTFLQIVELDPPAALRKSDFSHSSAGRMLAEALRNYGEFDKASRLQNQSGLRFSLGYRKFTIWFDFQSALRISEEKVGGLKVSDLSETFWESSTEEQKKVLSAVVAQIPNLERDDTAPVSIDEALAQFRNPELARDILNAILEHWPQSPSTGRGTSIVKEISCQTGATKVRLAPYKGYDRVILNTGMQHGWIHLAREYVRESLNFEEPESEKAKGQLNIPMQEVQEPEEIQKLLGIIEKLSRLERPLEQ